MTPATKRQHKRGRGISLAAGSERKVGDRCLVMGGIVRIMAIAEGYAMVRRKGCVPFCVYLKELTDDASQTR